MKNNEIVLERVFDVPVKRVWKALTNNAEMKRWYFDIPSFKAEVGCQFQFTGGHDDGIQYLHLCEITEVILNQKITYSWKYDGYSGVSYVTFELFDLGKKTLLKLTHCGIDTFPTENPDFALNNFEEGWNQIINKSLENYLDKENFQHEINVNVSLDKAFTSITKDIPFWWTEMYEGDSSKVGRLFTVRFGSAVFKTLRVDELIPNQKVVWFVTDTLINIPELKNKTEWLNTRIVWDLKTEKTNTIIRVTHIGLYPDIECYDICSMGWQQFCESLKSYVEKGIGMPFKQESTNK